MLRCTRKALTLLGRNIVLADAPASDDDWYLNLLWIEGRKCLLLTHAGTLFSVFAPDVRAADLRPVGPYLVRLVEKGLVDEALPRDCLGPLDAGAVHIGRTQDRRVLGIMNDLAALARADVQHAGGLRRCDFGALNHWLRRTLHNRGGFVTAMELVAERVAATP